MYREHLQERERARSRYLASLLRLFAWLQAFRLSVWGLCRETKHAVISVTSLAAGTQHTPQQDKAPWQGLQLSPSLLRRLTLRTTVALGMLGGWETPQRERCFFSYASRSFSAFREADKRILTQLNELKFNSISASILGWGKCPSLEVFFSHWISRHISGCFFFCPSVFLIQYSWRHISPGL